MDPNNMFDAANRGADEEFLRGERRGLRRGDYGGADRQERITAGQQDAVKG
jgi:hypothetical protein